jgi:hypothetical protein
VSIINPDIEGGFSENSIIFSALWVTLTGGGGGAETTQAKADFREGALTLV